MVLVSAPRGALRVGERDGGAGGDDLPADWDDAGWAGEEGEQVRGVGVRRVEDGGAGEGAAGRR